MLSCHGDEKGAAVAGDGVIRLELLPFARIGIWNVKGCVAWAYYIARPFATSEESNLTKGDPRAGGEKTRTTKRTKRASAKLKTLRAMWDPSPGPKASNG